VSAEPPGVGYAAVIGLARSGRAAAALLARRGWRVYASDSADTPALHDAARALEGGAVEVQLGGHDLGRIAGASLVVLSPGIPPDAPPVRHARAAGARVVSEVAVALEALHSSRVLAVTGTNGKSTTTALIAHLLCTAGHEAVAAGNIGRALSEVALDDAQPAYIAVELSSFQLHDTPGVHPVVGVLTNLSPDHLDRYGTVEEYYADKALLFAAATDDSRWVTNADDAAVQRMAAGAPGTHYRFSLRSEADAWYDVATGELKLLGAQLCARGDVRMLGAHNVANALAAALAVAAAAGGEPDDSLRETIAEGLRTFPGLPHRLEVVGEFAGVLWVNDSKATNVESARVSLEAMDRPTVLLLGGRHKGESYASLLAAMRNRVRCVIAYGEAAPLIQRDLGDDGPQVIRGGAEFDGVVDTARSEARPGDVVLLAPACSSFDMFRDYEERGNAFRVRAGSP
jgi:UDP-N-acetylmuramoylalanine--D-glutamate ligase